MIYLKSTYKKLPEKAGVYIYSDKDSNILYVGKANNLKSRVSSYFLNNSLLGEKTRLLVSQIEKIKITIVESELEALLLEAFYIKKYKPKYNIRLNDDKSYVQIGISIKDKYPVVQLARRGQDKNSIYFGPYPNSSAVKLVLKTIRKVFPFVSAPNHPKRICLYNHLGLCPCPPIFDSIELKTQYRKNINGIIRILEGQSQKVLKELEKQRKIQSENENYEEANEINKKISALKIITEPHHLPFEYHVNPNLRTDIREQEMRELMQVLNAHDLDLKNVNRIECYDISNIQGTRAVGSMVVFTNGEKDSSQYRKFKIKIDGKPNDFAMMEEVIKRRIGHIADWGLPDLIIVDGGKGQVTSGLKALFESKVRIPLIGLAKREETIIIPQGEWGMGNGESMNTTLHLLLHASPFTEVSLPRNSKALHLIMRIRDEAHRFAITYHRLLRSKNALSG